MMRDVLGPAIVCYAGLIARRTEYKLPHSLAVVSNSVVTGAVRSRGRVAIQVDGVAVWNANRSAGF